MCYIDQRTAMRNSSAHLCKLSGAVGRWIVFAVLALLSAEGSAFAQSPQTQGLRVVPLVRGEDVFVRFELRDGLTNDVRAAIESGLKTTFTYTVDLRVDAPGWLDRTIGSAVVTNSVKHNTLLRTYRLERHIDGRLQEQADTDDEEVMRQWLTSMASRPLFRTSLLQRNREYYVRVNATARPSSGSILWPFGSGTSAQTRFTFMP